MLIEAPAPTLTPEVLQALNRAKPSARPGRPYGSKNKRRRAMEDYLSKFAPEVLETLVARAIAGDHVCLALYMERVYPKPSRAPEPVDNVLAVKTPDDARAAMAQLIQQVMAGELAGDQASDVMGLLGAYLAAHNVKTISAMDEANSNDASAAPKLFMERMENILRARQAKPPAADGGA